MSSDRTDDSSASVDAHSSADSHSSVDIASGSDFTPTPDPHPTRVLAQGTFDILHPGHVHYLREAAAMGEELHVVVANPQTVTHKPAPVLPLEHRRELLAALECVDYAHPGHPTDISVPVRLVDPDILVLGHDQHHDEAEVATALESWGIDCEVRRASAREPRNGEVLSSSDIKASVRDARARRTGEEDTLESV